MNGPVPGLKAVRAELERRPRDSSAAGPLQALEALRLEWGYTHHLAWHEGLYCAQRTGPGGKPCGLVLTGKTPHEIGQALSRDWGEA